ncbi:MAG: hypothetical protein ABI777_07310 [Betaproteobacteria bacterium]
MRLRTRGLFSIRRLRRALSDRLRGTPFDRALDAAIKTGNRDFVFGWNRGLGDIALGLVPLFARIRARCPDSRIVVVTRPDLAEMAALAGVDDVVIVDDLARDAPVDPLRMAENRGIVFRHPPTVFADPDPTRWLDGQRQTFAPRLVWDASRDAQALHFAPPIDGRIVIGAHVNSETAQYYGYVKDWPAESWRALIARFPAERGVQWLLFGNAPQPRFEFSNVTDVRGSTSLHELLALVRTQCRVLLAPDSGILTAVFYLEQNRALDVVSLWSDPRQGILKQGCASPNPALKHHALLGRDDDVRNLSVDDVDHALTAIIEDVSCRSHPDLARAD